MRKLFDYLMDHVLDPALQWILEHPIITVLVITVLVWWVGQAYKTRTR
ncbi:MAG TPA: hypothetical protein VNL14_05160 [Candidatus Acidoferrales bacterium]|nr:hypothetical protein [Candidatus Acidoferrales bacterium]